MPDRENYNPQHHDSKYLHADNISSLKCEIKDTALPSVVYLYIRAYYSFL
jgi:hypothetical protein